MITVTKFGGSSVADAKQFEKIKNIIKSDEKRKIVVVSAPGKRFSGDNKVTDLLFLLSAHIKYGVDYTNILDLLKNRYKDIVNELNLSIDIDKEFEYIIYDVKNGQSEEYLVSRGEYLCAKMMAEYIGFTFVDSSDIIKFRYDGAIDEDLTIKSIQERFDSAKSIVVPGFYGTYPTGEIKLFSRGGSDITGSILAMGVNASLYENWTDVSGLLVTDPKIVKNPIGISEITYDELRELSYMGASVLHEETILPIKDLNIPIQILNTNRPEDKGTIICRESSKNGSIITGIAGKKNFKVLSISKTINSSKLEIIEKALDVLKKYNVPVEHVPTSIDSFGLIVENKNVENKLFDILSEIKKIDDVISIDVDNDLSLVAVVGRNMALKPGISGTIFSIFGKNGINIKTISQSVKETSIIVGVSNKDFERTIQCIYNDMISEG